MKFKAQINGKEVRNPFLKLGLAAIGLTIGLSLMFLLALPLIGAAVLIGAGTLIALPLISRFGKISKIDRAPKNVTPDLSTPDKPRLIKPVDPVKPPDS